MRFHLSVVQIDTLLLTFQRHHIISLAYIGPTASVQRLGYTSMLWFQRYNRRVSAS